jgi:LysM repeat protein
MKLVLPVALVVLALMLPASASAAGTVYVVQRGDTLTRIAARYCTTVGAIQHLNGLPNPNYIWAGQRLSIPGPGCGVPPPPCGSYYTVRHGDTLSQIARRYGTTVWAIQRANGLANPNYIWPGQRLYIPCGRYPPPPPPPPPPPCTWTYVVRAGDTLYAIAARYGTSVQPLAAINHLRNPSYIYVGQRLKIPC